MAAYNTFIAQETTTGRVLLVTSSARKVKTLLTPSTRIEVWSANTLRETIDHTSTGLEKYEAAEREYIREKQARAQEQNRMRREWQ